MHYPCRNFQEIFHQVVFYECTYLRWKSRFDSKFWIFFCYRLKYISASLALNRRAKFEKLSMVRALILAMFALCTSSSALDLLSLIQELNLAGIVNWVKRKRMFTYHFFCRQSTFSRHFERKNLKKEQFTFIR